jgi:hypothetical protein
MCAIRLTISRRLRQELERQLHTAQQLGVPGAASGKCTVSAWHKTLLCGQVDRESVTRGKSMPVPQQISEGFWPPYDRCHSITDIPHDRFDFHEYLTP